ncbi:MAG: nucleotidyl transferase AbiEii/AbiGii toxin family protein [Coriobacteriia bacterium]|nr:nucleotidyl transferase AbiEii/AbiGii toxin family protein [Coriobacteriia bacterium]
MNEYKTSAGLEQAVKEAARKSNRPVQVIQEEYYRSRLLARIFTNDTPSFVLKGGAGILARIPDARRTRDIDLYASDDFEIDESINELVKLASLDLGDFYRFELVSVNRYQQEATYRKVIRLGFRGSIGAKQISSIFNIDLVFGCVPTAPIEKRLPKNLEGFPYSEVEYYLYPLVDHIADKVCAIVEKHGSGYSSSRVKDLVDLCVIALNESVRLRMLARALLSETNLRDLYPLYEFTIPDEWSMNPQSAVKLLGDLSMPNEFRSLRGAFVLAKSFIDPALQNTTEELSWNPGSQEWVSSEDFRPLNS